jgi:hypothetical protein
MKLIAIVGAFLCVNTVIAAPFTELRREWRTARQRTRAVPNKHSLPPQNITTANVDGPLDNSVKAQYSSNWAGAVLTGSGYTTVTGTIVVPTPQKPSGGSSRTQYAASAWVGIDGDTCQSAILQTGVDFYVEDGQASFDAWYEWFPDYAYNFDGFTINTGDRIKMTVTTNSTSSGIATIENLTTGQTVSHSFSGESSSLCETDAEWIVEDFSSGSSLVPFADFNTVTFTDASVTTTDGTTLGVAGATILDIQQNNHVLTDCSIQGDSTVTCSYV